MRETGHPFSIANLNDRQREAALFGDGPFRIMAGAGTGKTATLTSRFVHLVLERGIPAHQILALTFSVKAAEEMRFRVEAQLPGSHRRLWIQTFHALCLRLIGEWASDTGQPRPQVISDEDRFRFAVRAVAAIPEEELGAHRGEAGRRKLVRDALTMIGRAKDDLLTPADVLAIARDPVRGSDRLLDLARAYESYQAHLARAGVHDFGDLVLAVVDRMRTDDEMRDRTRSRFRHVLVDEFQDTNRAQFELLRQIVPPHGNLCVVGDPNQAIYAFRGGRAEYMTDFARHFAGAETIQLTANYRSRPEILDAANRLIEHDRDHAPFKLVAASLSAGALITLTEARSTEHEAELIAQKIAALVRDSREPRAYHEIAVLFRSVNQSAEPLLRALRLRGIPASLGAKTQVDFEVMQDVLAALRLVVGPPVWADAARLASARGLPGPDRLALERRFDLAERDSLLIAPAVPNDLPEAEQTALSACRTIEQEAAALRNLPLDILLYHAIALTGKLTEDLDQDTGGLLSSWIDQAGSLARSGASTDDLLAHFSAGMLPDDDEVPDSSGGVRIQTAHAAKGLEWPVVFLAGMAETIFPVRMKLDREFEISDLARTEPPEGDMPQGSEQARALAYRNEERRLAYVAVTRAQHELHVTLPRSNGDGPLAPSTFVAELDLAGAPSLDGGESDSPAASMRELRRSLRRRQQRALMQPLHGDGTARAITDLLLAQWAATGEVPGATPLRQRGTPHPHDSDTALRFSFSQIDTYESCPRQYLYGTVLRIAKESTSPHTALGIGVHGALSQLNETWKATGRIPGDDEIDAALERAWPATGFDCLPQEAQLKQRGRAMIRRYFAQERERQTQRRPLEIESWLEAQVQAHLMHGRLDLAVVDKSGRTEIIDFKTGSPGQYKPVESLQLYLYALAWQQSHGGTLPEVAYLALKHPDDKGFTTGETWDSAKQEKAIQYSAEELSELGERLNGLLDGILANDFTPDPEDRRCGMCSFQWMCPAG